MFVGLLVCFFPHGLPLEVLTASDGTPVELHWQGRLHTVERVLRCWRIDECWWRRRVWRDYWQLATYSGLVLLVFRELPDGDGDYNG